MIRFKLIFDNRYVYLNKKKLWVIITNNIKLDYYYFIQAKITKGVII